MADAGEPREAKMSLVDKVSTWLDTQGYPLEMRTARAFTVVGADVQVGQFYTDYESEQPREIDVIATFTANVNGFMSRVSFVVECKRSSLPWVLFATQGVPTAGALQMRVYHSRWSTQVDAVSPSWVASRPSIDFGTGLIAYSGTPVFFSGKSDKDTGPDAVFSALMSSSKAAYSLAKLDADKASAIPHIYFPVIVAETKLFSCVLPTYGPDVIEVKEIPGGIPLRWARQIGGRTLTAVDIVSADALTPYVQESAALAWALTNALSIASRPTS